MALSITTLMNPDVEGRTLPTTELIPSPNTLKSRWDRVRRAIVGNPQTLAAVTSLMLTPNYGVAPRTLEDDHSAAQHALSIEAAQVIVIGEAQALSNVNLRPEATTEAAATGSLPAGVVVDVIAETRGQNVNGNDLWLLIRTQEGSTAYAWSGAFHYVRLVDTGSPIASVPTPEQPAVISAAEPHEGEAALSIRPEILAAVVPDSAIPVEILNAPVPRSAETSVIISLDGKFYRSVPFDMPGNPRYQWNEENQRWHDQHPGRDEYERLLPGGNLQILAQAYGDQINGWNQAEFAYQRDDGALFYPGLGTELVNGSYDSSDLSDGWVRQSDTLVSSDYEAGEQGLYLELGISLNHPIYRAIPFDRRVNTAAQNVIVADILARYPNLAGKHLIVQVIADDMTNVVFHREGGVSLFVSDAFSTGSSNLGHDVVFIRLSVTLRLIERTDGYFGMHTLSGLVAALDEYSTGTKRDPREGEFYDQVVNDIAAVTGERFDPISPIRK